MRVIGMMKENIFIPITIYILHFYHRFAVYHEMIIFAIYYADIRNFFVCFLLYNKHRKGGIILVQNYMLETKTAESLYAGVKDLPIVDYHCHLSPQEIFEDKPFENIGVMWLSGDHYKWRLMRTAGIDEHFITGDAGWHDKFIKYAEALEFAAGNPLYHWSHMELSMFFEIDDPLTAASAEDIWNRANTYIAENNLSPRKLMALSRVEAVCTTDDIVDTLEWHQKIREDAAFNIQVLPSFRTDNLLLMRRAGYADYVEKLSAAAGVVVKELSSLKTAVENRLKFFVENGCKFTDVGMPYFPGEVAGEAAADATFRKLLKGETVTDADYLALIGHLYVFLGELYRENDLVMQWHLAVSRNANSALFRKNGADCGVDCVGDVISGKDLIAMLDAINETGGLPQTVIYTLNEANAAEIASIAGAFPGVRCGAAWWFCDHKRGIREEMEIIAENSSIGSFLGMLTDSRSFLSYARHDYFRRILCTMLGEWVEKGEFAAESAAALAQKIAYTNIKTMIGGAV